MTLNKTQDALNDSCLEMQNHLSTLYDMLCDIDNAEDREEKSAAVEELQGFLSGDFEYELETLTKLAKKVAG